MDLFGSEEKLVVLEEEGLVHYYPHFLVPKETLCSFQKLFQEIDWHQDVVVMYGKKITTQRKYAWHGDEAYNYRYSGQDRIAQPWTSGLLEIKTKVEELLKVRFNCCLLNYYASGEEGMSWHSDDEKMMRSGAPIASVSLGAARKFAFKNKNNPNLKKEIILDNGSLLVMLDETQNHYWHALTKSKKVKNPRINLTFRIFA